MKKGFAVFAVLLFLLSAAVTQAATLEEGWYVKLGLVALFGCDSQTGTEFGIDWNFVGGLGTYGPFEISSPDPVWAERMVSVQTTVNGVSPGTSVYIWGVPEVPVTFPATSLLLFWETNYDASKMRLEMLSFDGSEFTSLWSQTRSGLNSDANNILSDTQSIPAGSVPVFRVTVVPEPSTFTALACFVTRILVRRRMR